jgi:acyl-coenzyme A thioesterase PaaI-like protein
VIDMATTLPLIVFDRDHVASVTVDLSMSCLSAAQEGDILDLDCSVLKSGRNLGWLWLACARLFKRFLFCFSFSPSRHTTT